MYIQLGNFIFDKAFTPDSISHSDESSFAEHALINLKPRLQPTGNNLEEINFSIRLRAELVNITQTVLAIKKAKDEAEILPFLYGYGTYRGDYIITKIEENIIFSLSDGTPIEVSLSISLKEYLVPDKLQQQQNAARKSAFATGDKQPVRGVPVDKFTQPQQATKDLSAAYSKAAVTDNNIRSYQNNVSQQATLSDKIQNALTSMDKSLDAANETINSITLLSDAAAIASYIAGVKNSIANFTFPITDITILNDNNRDMQSAIRNLKKGSFELTNLVITRNG